MNADQKKLIVQEIRNWKSNKLLPAEYCDFLLNLYADPDSFSAEQQGATAEREVASRKRSFVSSQLQRIMLLIGAVLLCLIFAFNFTLFPMPMQIVVLLIATFLPFLLAARLGKDSPLIRIGWLAAAAVFLAVDGYYVLFRTGLTESRGALIAVMAIVFLLWVLVGGIGRTRLIASIGYGGLLLMFATVLEEFWQVGNTSYGVQHLYWIIPAASSLFLAYLLGRAGVYIAPVFLGFGLLALFGPELQMLMQGKPMEFLVQAIVFFKMATLIAFGVVYRGTVKNWVQQLSA